MLLCFPKRGRALRLVPLIPESVCRAPYFLEQAEVLYFLTVCGVLNIYLVFIQNMYSINITKVDKMYKYRIQFFLNVKL